MTVEQGLIAAILLAAIVMFAWGRWRHDMVALAALLLSVAAGLVPGEEAFAGFGHPAVITVACVLVLSRGLQTSGAIDTLAVRLIPAEAGPMLSIGLLSVLAAVLSAFMNNVGALALLMPLALQRARKLELAPGQVLMPLAFASILGGMATLIGTPPNLVVSAFRAQNGGSGFAMFDFAPVGLAVAAAGVVFVVAFARLLVPARTEASLEGFDTAAYLTEAKAPEKAKAVGMSLAEVETALEAADVQVLGLLRNEVRLRAPNPAMTVRAGDILQLQAEPEALTTALAQLGLVLEEAEEPEKEPENENEKPAPEKPEAKQASGDSTAPVLREVVVMPGAGISGRSATDIALRTRYGVNLLAISRQGRRSVARLRATPLAPGDVLLMQGREEAIATFAADLGCVPLAPRALNLPDRRRIVLAVGLMLGAIGLAASGIVAVSVAFAAGMLGAMVTNVVPPRTVYGAIDWPVIVLLAALIPVAGAVESTGLADLLARTLLENIAGGDAMIALVLILVVTMTLSDVVNNAATAAVMCPIALGAAATLGVSPDAFLMAVAVGASCAFLTPIGHQNNTLILGPGGFHFGDYWRLGLPLEIIVVVVAVPMLLLVWPL